jgi:(p)ppGpp synthase/HD superfamily hydrolase
MSKVQLAIEIARRAHKGQVDKLGADYINHPLRVHRNLLSHPTFATLDAASQEDCEVAAIMHDVVEDSGVGPESEPFTVDDLLSQNFSPRSIELVQLLTRKPEDVESKKTYYENINANPLAKLVKWADIADNLNVHRTAALPPEKKARLADRYEHALAIIKLEEADKAWLEDTKQLPVELKEQ